MKTLHLLALAALAFPAAAPEAPPFNPQGRPNRNRPGPWDNDVLVYRLAADGGPEKLATFERAGVPTVARLKDGRFIAAFQHFPAGDDRNFDRVAVRFSEDEGRTWSKPEPIAVEGLESGLARPFDPTLAAARRAHPALLHLESQPGFPPQHAGHLLGDFLQRHQLRVRAGSPLRRRGPHRD